MKRIAEALVECGYAAERAYPKNCVGEFIEPAGYTPAWGVEVVNPFADTLEGRRQLMVLYFYTLFPDKQHTITGDGHFDAYEQIKNHVQAYFDQLEEE